METLSKIRELVKSCDLPLSPQDAEELSTDLYSAALSWMSQSPPGAFKVLRKAKTQILRSFKPKARLYAELQKGRSEALSISDTIKGAESTAHLSFIELDAEIRRLQADLDEIRKRAKKSYEVQFAKKHVFERKRAVPYITVFHGPKRSRFFKKRTQRFYVQRGGSHEPKNILENEGGAASGVPLRVERISISKARTPLLGGSSPVGIGRQARKEVAAGGD
jgi:hypothetical protein